MNNTINTLEVVEENCKKDSDDIYTNSSMSPQKPSVKKNYFYNLAYQIFLLIIPLATTPYISRVLLPEGVGKYSFSYSLITYFTIFASLGFGYYAQREIAKHQSDLSSQTKDFWEICICRIIPCSISLIVNIFLCIFSVYGDYNILMWILNINIVAVLFDVAFYYQGNEKFKSIILRNFFIKALALAAVFIFIKSSSDLWIYTLINSLSLLMSTLSMWFPLRKLLVPVKLNTLKPLSHLKGTLILFLPTIAVSIYTILDKTLIGLLITDTYTYIDEYGVETIKKYSDLENGFYEQSEKIVKIIMTFITAIGIVMIPRNSNEIAKGNIDKVINNIYKTSNFVLIAGVPMVLGLIIVSDFFVPWFFGDGYEKCSILLKILSPLIFIIGLSNVFGLQFLIPMGRDKQFTIALVVGSITNIILNVIFIKIWWSIGASIATIVAEIFVTATMSFMIRKEVNIFKILVNGWKYYISGAGMFTVLFFVSRFFTPSILSTFLLVIIGIFVYVLSLLLLKDKTFILVLIYIFKRIKMIFVRKK